jgi:arabinan endo-1,5-alpha-L-arabinosidase
VFVILSCTSEFRRPASVVIDEEYIYDSKTSFADPAVLKAADGFYYAYATQSRVEGKEQNIQCAWSENLTQWVRLPDCLPKKPDWASERQNFWAPHVSYFNGKYAMYVSVEQNEGGFCVAVGTADFPMGPFQNFKRLVCGKDFENIDPMAFEDPATGEKYLFWGSASKPLKGQKLTRDGLGLESGSKMIEVLKNKREPRGLIKVGQWHYAFGTQMGPEFEKKSHVQVQRSRDFLNWEKLPDAMPVSPAWAYGVHDHWTPQVVKRGKKFQMFLTIQKDEKTYCISQGESKKVEGPYLNFTALDCSQDYKLVNPLFRQEEEKELLVWEDPSWKKINHREIVSDGTSFAPEKAISEDLMSSSYRFRRKGHEDLVEGAWVNYHNGWYYLYYSGDECCSDEAHYAVSVARSKKPLGPYKKHGVILQGNSNWLGPGHNSTVIDDKGKEWIVFHAIPAWNKKIRVNAKETEVNRVMLRREIRYSRDGWPVVEAWD